MHIIQVSSYYPPHLGGQEYAVQELASQLALAGHKTHVLTSTAGGGAKGSTLEQGVAVQRLPGFVFGHAPVMPQFPTALFETAKPGSVVHVHIGQAFTPELVWLVSRLRRFRYIAQLHIDFKPSGPAGFLLPLYKQLVLKHVLRAAAAVVVLNEQTLQVVRKAYGYAGRARIMSNSIDEAYFKLTRPQLAARAPQTLRLLFVGRLSPQKNVNALLHALKLTNHSVHLDVVGDGEDRDAVRRTIAQLGLRNVTMHGRLPRDEVMQLYATCDALIMPSLYEAQPLVLLEALAARLPIIGTNVIGVADHIRGAGIIVEPSPEGLADGIDQYYRHHARLPTMVEQGYQLVESRRWVHNLKNYEALYEEISGG